MPSLPPKEKTFSILAKDSLKIEIEPSRSALFHMKTRVFLKYFVGTRLWKQFFASNLPQAPSNLTFFDNFGNSKVFNTVLT